MRLLLVALGTLACGVSIAAAGTCDVTAHNRVSVVDGALIYSTPILNVDADGAPGSYRLDGNGLSYTCDGVAAIENGRPLKVGAPNWQEKCQAAWKAARVSGDYSKVHIFGFAVDTTGAPLIQKEGDPLPGEAFVSTTFVEVTQAEPKTQRRYVNAMTIPYVVLPESVRHHFGVKDAAVAVVWRPKRDKLTFAVFADTGGNLDEGSVRLHEELGGTPLTGKQIKRAKQRIEDPVTIAVFPDQAVSPRLDAADWRAAIERAGREALDAWGGIQRLKLCATTSSQ
jgi:hypothetical protein